MKTIMQWIVAALAIGITAYLLPGVEVTLLGAFVLAVVLAIINIFIKPVLFVLTLPVNVLTLGLFSLVINAFLVLGAAQVVPGFNVDGFWSAFFFAIVLALVNVVFGVKKD